MNTLEQAKKNVEFLNAKNQKGYLWYNGSESRQGAIDCDQYCDTYEEAVKCLANQEDVTEEDIINDYDNWYYIELVSEALESEQYTVKYEEKFI
ncbi:hypothetical protein ACTFAO_07480 [Sphingobacterium spiritivorum]|uniref:hypothetical protein n=1 Tax=Sphingobacterium spiritivorum TaxID=258 RepID=UPI003F7756F2